MSTTSRRLGKYELQERLGRGGMAEVWKALDTQLQRYVAIKLLSANLQADPNFVSRFTREAQTIAALHHPNIVQIYDFHIAESSEVGAPESDAVAYMVMEYIRGGTLADYIKATSHRKQFPPAAETIRLFTPISLAIDYAHSQGMIHRDIKPANILLDRSHMARNPMGEPILSDFGLAKVLSAASQTLTGAVLGTPLYISPEQVQNGPVSKETDLYALGAVLYEIFAGVPPFQGDSLNCILMQHLINTPVAPHLVNPNLPPALSQVLLKSLAKNPQDRFKSASAMIAVIAEAFNIAMPEDLKHAISSAEDTHLLADQRTATRAGPTEPRGMAPTSSSAATISSSSASLEVPPDAETSSSDPGMLPTLATMKAEAMSGAGGLPDSETQLSAQVESAVELARQSDAVHHPGRDESGTLSPRQDSYAPPHPTFGTMENSSPATKTPLPVLTPPPDAMNRGRHPGDGVPTASRKRRGLVLTLVVLLICVVGGSVLGAFFLLNHGSTTTPVVTNSIVGQAFFLSSGKLNLTSNQGSNDEFQVNLSNIQDPHSGNSYYAWLLPDTKQVEAASLLLGKVQVNHGVIHFFYAGDDQHSNLLTSFSRFLITEEPANLPPSVPSPDPSNWRYYAALPQTPAAGQTYSLLDHLRHLLTSDPNLESLHLAGGLNIWAYRNTQTMLNFARSARDDWNAKNFTAVHQEIVKILDYLDGSKFVAQDVPAGTPILADSRYAQVGLLQLHANQQPPGYLYHIQLHLNGVLASPGSTQSQRKLASRIDTGINYVKGWLGQEHQDAVQLVHMSDAQLALSSSLVTLNDLVTQANNALNGRNDPSTGQQPGIAQVYRDVQSLATFDVKPYH